ncbi:hypothetical protein [Mycolicibacterium diernhoferi]|uniref:Uncharacterized protein n=1 Tax=Mycolicibacterium diernhoferi TaxID=1801 RepID=A0A1Q4HBG4_9MYCO|nr:hypothetical protein [Mycolicibacterium diernhoferi]OJZ64886.1 hypothetical protein BRW64_16365 [Mycolicibacterium diernhoferi]OPE54635.1 hypothetical protein BV510_09225 [Mycolicibacterium diernhoferi]PEG53006.1 hypothetical protein CRI78_18600 [Mycolicibacterium diernhoferi]QYL22637.1 hypothetical protein K0O62_27610 [Mycolicibacterium diernhoferi]
MTEPVPPAVAVALGLVAAAGDGVALVCRGAEQLPVVGGWLHRSRRALQARGEQVLGSGIEMVLDQLDLNALARQRIDLIGLADEVVDGIDLPAIIKQSTDSVTAEVMTDVRSQGERADDLVAGLVDRLLRREREQL